jgi:hypothetical protein
MARVSSETHVSPGPACSRVRAALSSIDAV